MSKITDLENMLAERDDTIDHYDGICTEARNILTQAGIPEMTENGLHTYSLSKRVAMLKDRLDYAVKIHKKVAQERDELLDMLEKYAPPNTVYAWEHKK